MRQLECQLGILECWKRKKSPDIPHLLRSLRQTEYPKCTLSFETLGVFWRFHGQIYLFQASKYTYRGQKYTDDKLYL